MKLTKILAGIAAGIMIMLPAVAAAQSGIHSPMTQAVLQVYEEELAENPRNYEVLMSRAEEYYRHGEYIRAIDDINRAIEYMPAGQTEMRMHAYILRAGIHNRSHRYEQALNDLNEAVRLSPESYSATLQRANTEFELGQFGDAKADYQRLQRMNARRAEAYIGQAKVAVKENNLGTANEMLETAVNLNPNDAETYIQRSEVRKMMGNHNGAVDDLILALSSDSRNSIAMSKLVEYGNTNYPATIAGLTNAISAAPNVGMFRYLRAGIAQGHYHYLAALEDYQIILDSRLYNYHGIYASIAECQFALGRYEQALASIDYALGMVRDTASYFTLRSKILRTLGRNQEAVEAAATALAVDRNDCEGLVEMALAYVGIGNYEEASNLLGEAMLNNAEEARYPMLRAWVLEKYLNNSTAAAQMYQKVADMDNYYVDNVRSFKGFALLFTDQTEAAYRWIENILVSVPDYDGLIHYYAACFYDRAGNMEKALQCATMAMDLGYANYYEWMDLTDGRVRIGELRDDLRFLNQVSRHDAIFGRE